MSHDSKLTNDLHELKGVAYHPSLRLISPFIPFLIHESLPITVLLLVFPIVDFFSMPGRLSRKYIAGFEKWYLVLFIFSLIIRIILEFISILFWTIPIILVPIAAVIWGGFAWKTWWELYDKAQFT